MKTNHYLVPWNKYEMTHQPSYVWIKRWVKETWVKANMKGLEFLQVQQCASLGASLGGNIVSSFKSVK